MSEATMSDGARFALYETRAQAWLAELAPWNHAPFKYEWRYATQRMIHHAIDDGIITDTLHRDAETLALEIQQGGIISGATYRWLLSVSTGDNPDDYLTLASPPDELDALTTCIGPEGAMDVLRAAVTAGNLLADELGRHTRAAQDTRALAERVPEVSQLLAELKGIEQTDGSWPGGDVVDMLTSWFDRHGYDIDAPLTVDEQCERSDDERFGPADAEPEWVPPAWARPDATPHERQEP